MKINAVDRQGKEHTLEGRDGWSVMEILRDGGLDMLQRAHGRACACATCACLCRWRSWFEKLPAPSEIEEIDVLDMALAVEPNSRLRLPDQCMAKPPTGLKVTVAPE